MSTIRSNRKCLKVVKISSYILGHVRKSSENRRKSSEVARMFSEIPLMTRQKSHAFDSEKVGRYINPTFLFYSGPSQTWALGRKLFIHSNFGEQKILKF